MQGKLVFVLGAATGYVLGTRAGRKGYEDLKRQLNDVLHDPRVQKTVSTAGEFARDKIPVVGSVVGDLAKKASEPQDDAAPKHSAEPSLGIADNDRGENNA